MKVGTITHCAVAVVVAVAIVFVVVAVNGIARQGQTDALGSDAQLVRLSRVGTKEDQSLDIIVAAAAAGTVFLHELTQSGREKARLGKIRFRVGRRRQVPRLAPSPHHGAAHPALLLLGGFATGQARVVFHDVSIRKGATAGAGRFRVLGQHDNARRDAVEAVDAPEAWRRRGIAAFFTTRGRPQQQLGPHQVE